MLHLVETTKNDRPSTLVLTVNEADRLAALGRYEILDTPPEAAFDHITALAAALFKAPIAIISFLDGDRLWFKSHHGLEASQISWAPDASGTGAEWCLRREFTPSFFASAPLRTADGYDLGTLCVIDRQPRPIETPAVHHLEGLAQLVIDQLELRLVKNLAGVRGALMASEVDHRAMNSLQFVASLLHLQSRTAGPEASRQLTTAANRVLAVARVHRNFAGDEAANRVPVLVNLRRLCGELSDILGAPVTVDGRDASVPARQILAISLMVNELVTNAKKHGDGAIRVTFGACGDGQHELRVVDHGRGLPKDFSLEARDAGGIGMRVIAALANQLDGKLTAGLSPGGKGACFTVTFPAL
jgi:two-component sensor histidine kinase